MTMKQRDVQASLLRKGFELKESHHKMFVYCRRSDNKKTTVFTRMSQGETEISSQLIAQMQKQCKLGRDDFQRLIECPLSREAYEELLRGQGIDV